MSPKIPVPPGEAERSKFFRELFSEKTYDDLQKYRFYDASEKNLRYVDINNDVREGVESIGAALYIFEDEDIDKKLVKYTDRLVEYTGTDLLYYKEPSFKNTISTIGRSIIRHTTAKPNTAKPTTARRGGKNRRSSNNKQKTRKTRKQ